MSWANNAIEVLELGHEITISPKGNSMVPLVHSGDMVRVGPISNPAELKKGDIVLVRVKGNIYLHLISAADKNRVQISNNRGRVNGWVKREKVYGIAKKIERAS